MAVIKLRVAGANHVSISCFFKSSAVTITHVHSVAWYDEHRTIHVRMACVAMHSMHDCCLLGTFKLLFGYLTAYLSNSLQRLDWFCYVFVLTPYRFGSFVGTLKFFSGHFWTSGYFWNFFRALQTVRVLWGTLPGHFWHSVRTLCVFVLVCIMVMHFWELVSFASGSFREHFWARNANGLKSTL